MYALRLGGIDDRFQPKTEFRFIEMHARYRSFDPENNVRRIAGGVPQSGH